MLVAIDYKLGDGMSGRTQLIQDANVAANLLDPFLRLFVLLDLPDRRFGLLDGRGRGREQSSPPSPSSSAGAGRLLRRLSQQSGPALFGGGSIFRRRRETLVE